MWFSLLKSLFLVSMVAGCTPSEIQESTRNVRVGVDGPEYTQVTQPNSELEFQGSNGGVVIPEGAYEEPIAITLKQLSDEGEEGLIIETNTLSGSDLPQPTEDIEVCIKTSNDKKGKTIKAQDTHEPFPEYLKSFEKTDSLCTMTRIMNGKFRITSAPLELNHDAAALSHIEIPVNARESLLGGYILNAKDTSRGLETSLVDPLGNIIPQHALSDKNLLVCLHLDGQNVSEIIHLSDGESFVLSGFVKEGKICASTDKLVGSFHLGAQPLTQVEVSQENFDSHQPILLVGPVGILDTLSLYSDAKCTTKISDSTVANDSTMKITAKLETEGSYTLYAAGQTAQGGQITCSEIFASYDYSVPPVAIETLVITSPSGALYSTDRSPELSVFGTQIGTIVEIFLDSNCKTTTGVKKEITANPMVFKFENLTEGSYQFYAQVQKSGHSSVCSTASTTYHIDRTAPTLQEFRLNNGASVTKESTVDITMTVADADFMYITNIANCGSGGEWVAYQTQKLDWALLQSDSTATVYAMFKDTAGNTTSCISDSITQDSTAPTGASITINNGATTTTLQQVSLQLAATGADMMYVTNNSDCASGGDWEAYATSKNSWNLGQTNATATVYTKFKDTAGNQTACLSDSIVHDTSGPSGHSIVIVGGTHTSNTTPDLILAATGADDMYITNTAGCTANGSWEAYTTSKSSWTLGQTNTTATVYVKFRDEAGNESSCVSDTIVHDNTAPSAHSLVIDGGTHTSDATPNLTLAATGATEIYITNTAGCTANGSWEAYATSKSSWTLGQTNATATVYVKFRDETENESSCVSDTIVHDDTAPTGAALVISSGATHTTSLTVSLAPSATDADEMYVTNTSGCSAGGSWESYAVSKTGWSLAQSNATATVYVQFRDNAGNTSSCVSDTIYHDASNPTAPGSPQDGSLTLINSTPTLSWTLGSDAESGVDGYEVAVGTSSGGNDTYNWALAGNNAATSATISNLSFVDNTTYYASIRTKDVAGNVSSSAPADGFLYQTPTAIGSGEYNLCALFGTGVIKCWGNAGDGVLGDENGLSAHIGDAANEMGSNLPAIDLGTGRTAVSFDVGGRHICAILDNGLLKCWGSGTNGRTGHGNEWRYGDAANQMGDNLPYTDLGTNRTALQVSAGMEHTCAILDNNLVKCWGRADGGQLGYEDTTFRGDDASEMGDNLPYVDLGTNRTATSVQTGASHTCALLDNSTIKCWGLGSLGRLGSGATADIGSGANEMGDNLGAVDVGTGRTVKKLAVGGYHTCVLLDNDDMKCWGDPAYGRLGNGDGSSAIGDSSGEMGDNLSALSLRSGKTVFAPFGGYQTSCAIFTDNTSQCWGRGTLGVLGLGDSTDRGDGANEMGDNLPLMDLTRN